MSKLIPNLLITVFLCLAAPIKANELPSCNDLADMANTLEEMEGALKTIEKITEGDEVDKALGEVVEGLKTIALVENDAHLSESVLQLSSAWEKMDGNQLMAALKNTIDDFDVIIGKECTK